MTRRSFGYRLGIASATALFPLAANSAVEPESAPRRYRLCLNPGAIGVRADQREAISLAHRHGFEAVEPMSTALAALSPTELQQLIAELKNQKLVWGAAGLPVNFRGEETQFAQDLKALPAIAAALKAAGVDRVGTWISPCHEKLTFTQHFELHRRRLREIALVLNDHGQRLGLEYVGTHSSLISRKYPFLHTLAETRDLIQAIHTGNVGLILDSWHWWQADDTEADLLTLRAQDIVAVDLNDAPAGVEKRQQRDGTRELPSATGVIDVRPFLGALKRLGYDGPVRAEPFNRALNDLDNDPACAKTITALRTACGPPA